MNQKRKRFTRKATLSTQIYSVVNFSDEFKYVYHSICTVYFITLKYHGIIMAHAQKRYNIIFIHHKYHVFWTCLIRMICFHLSEVP